MRKNLFNFIIFTTIIFLGIINVNAKESSNIAEYLENLDIVYSSTCDGDYFHPTAWEDKSYKLNLYGARCGGVEAFFMPDYLLTKNHVYNDVTNLKAKSSDTSILTVETRPYDFSKEKEYFEKVKKEYNEMTLEEVNERYCPYPNYDVSGGCKPYNEKPEWWVVYGFKEEPKTWWEAFKLDESWNIQEEPKNAYEVIVHGHDLGKATITLSADKKESIKIDWTIMVSDFDEYMIGSKEDLEKGRYKYVLVDILNNLDKYKDNIPEMDEDRKYNFNYLLKENEDISEIINALKGKDITIRFGSFGTIGSESYILNGLDIKNTVNKGFTYDHKISMETSINKDKIDNLVDLKDAIYIDFTYHGKLPAKYSLNVDVRQYIYGSFEEKLGCENYENPSDELNKCYAKVEEETQNYLKNTEFTLLYFNPDTNKMEVVKDKLKADGDTLTLDFDHFSSYVLASDYEIKPEKTPSKEPTKEEDNKKPVTDKEPTKDENNKTPTTEDKEKPHETTSSTSNNAQTGTTDVILYIVIAIITLGGMIYLFLNMKRDARN